MLKISSSRLNSLICAFFCRLSTTALLVEPLGEEPLTGAEREINGTIINALCSTFMRRKYVCVCVHVDVRDVCIYIFVNTNGDEEKAD